MTALDELRQALAEWDRLMVEAPLTPWEVGPAGLDRRREMIGAAIRWDDGPGPVVGFVETSAFSVETAVPFIVAAVGLADTVRAILAEAINEPDEGYDWTIYDVTALRLARAINGITS